MESTIPNREFFVVNYPGIVNNDERALKTLGGLPDLNKTFNSITRRLRLTFRPDMVFAKPVYGDPSPSKALIIRARQLRNKRTGETKLVTEIIGVASRVYNFTAMADFQYGPFEKVPSESPSTDSSLSPKPTEACNFRVFYDQLLVREPTRVLDHHLNAPNVPLFIPPLLFTKLDQPTMYCFSSRFRMNEYVELETKSQNHPYHRKERKSYAVFVNFGDPTPQAPNEGALLAITNLGTQTRKLAREVEKMFQRRPIWGKAALVHSLNWKRVRDCAIKIILPAYAYYVPNGPWGRVWVRFGYDPRNDPSSRIYQTVDYRVRSPRLQAKLSISGRRPRADARDDSDFSGSDIDDCSAAAGVAADDPSLLDASLASLHLVRQQGTSSSPPRLSHSVATNNQTSAFRFSQTSWPDARQILYQLVDIDVPEVVEMLAEPPVSRSTCDSTYGWMPSGYQQTIREIMTRCLESWALGDEQHFHPLQIVTRASRKRPV